MAEDDKKPADPAQAPAGTAETGAQANNPVWQIVTQYIKDLSFENPNAPGTLMSGANAGPTGVNINVQVNRVSDDIYAVDISLAVKASQDDKVMFNLELVYGGAFRIQNVPEAQLPPLLMIECPRLLFPFARQVLASTVQSGGFPPLMLEPVDFAALYRHNLQQMAEAQKTNGGSAPAANKA